MKHLPIFITTLLSIASSTAFANCDLAHFRWDCEYQLHLRPSKATPSLVYCGREFGYVSYAEYDELARYQRANVNLSLTVNDEYTDGPCIPADRN